MYILVKLQSTKNEKKHFRIIAQKLLGYKYQVRRTKKSSFEKNSLAPMFKNTAKNPYGMDGMGIAP